MSDDDAITAPLRARVRAFAANGATAEDIRQLCGFQADGTQMSAGEFQAAFARELAQGAAEANIEVSKTIFLQAAEGKQATIMLAWAKHRLGWSEGGSDHADTSTDDSAHTLAALQALLDQLAARKAGGDHAAAALAGAGPAQPAAAGPKH